MKAISREELKRKLDQGEDIKLVFALGAWQYHAMHIPGSLHIHTLEEALELLEPDDEIVVYCSNEACRASIFAYSFLVDRGFKKVCRFAGGLQDWDSAGYPLEGEMAAAAQFTAWPESKQMQ